MTIIVINQLHNEGNVDGLTFKDIIIYHLLKHHFTHRRPNLLKYESDNLGNNVNVSVTVTMH